MLVVITPMASLVGVMDIGENGGHRKLSSQLFLRWNFLVFIPLFLLLKRDSIYVLTTVLPGGRSVLTVFSEKRRSADLLICRTKSIPALTGLPEY
jgi:hypothetical protein